MSVNRTGVLYKNQHTNQLSVLPELHVSSLYIPNKNLVLAKPGSDSYLFMQFFYPALHSQEVPKVAYSKKDIDIHTSAKIYNNNQSQHTI